MPREIVVQVLRGDASKPPYPGREACAILLSPSQVREPGHVLPSGVEKHSAPPSGHRSPRRHPSLKRDDRRSPCEEAVAGDLQFSASARARWEVGPPSGAGPVRDEGDANPWWQVRGSSDPPSPGWPWETALALHGFRGQELHHLHVPGERLDGLGQPARKAVPPAECGRRVNPELARDPTDREPRCQAVGILGQCIEALQVCSRGSGEIAEGPSATEASVALPVAEASPTVGPRGPAAGTADSGRETPGAQSKNQIGSWGGGHGR